MGFKGEFRQWLALAGCAGIDAANKEPLLSAAGFVARTPEMPKQEELFYTAMITFPKCAPASR